MDILMPGKDGLQACHEIKTSLATKAIPVIMLTAIGQELDKRLSTELGADQYITKPFNPRGLVEIVDQFLRDAERV
jgi:DNA-binding response OmpR family regulator